MTTTTIRAGDRVDALDWDALRARLDADGHAITVPLLDSGECEELSDLFDGERFRSTVEMARHRFGDGRYRYFDHPLPDTIAALRTSFSPGDLIVAALPRSSGRRGRRRGSRRARRRGPRGPRHRFARRRA